MFLNSDDLVYEFCTLEGMKNLHTIVGRAALRNFKQKLFHQTSHEAAETIKIGLCVRALTDNFQIGEVVAQLDFSNFLGESEKLELSEEQAEAFAAGSAIDLLSYRAYHLHCAERCEAVAQRVLQYFEEQTYAIDGSTRLSSKELLSPQIFQLLKIFSDATEQFFDHLEALLPPSLVESFIEMELLKAKRWLDKNPGNIEYSRVLDLFNGYQEARDRLMARTVEIENLPDELETMARAA